MQQISSDSRVLNQEINDTKNPTTTQLRDWDGRAAQAGQRVTEIVTEDPELKEKMSDVQKPIATAMHSLILKGSPVGIKVGKALLKENREKQHTLGDSSPKIRNAGPRV